MTATRLIYETADPNNVSLRHNLTFVFKRNCSSLMIHGRPGTRWKVFIVEDVMTDHNGSFVVSSEGEIGELSRSCCKRRFALTE